MGSEFEVHLPIAAITRPQTPAAAINSQVPGRFRVVIVEDNTTPPKR